MPYREVSLLGVEPVASSLSKSWASSMSEALQYVNTYRYHYEITIMKL